MRKISRWFIDVLAINFDALVSSPKECTGYHTQPHASPDHLQEPNFASSWDSAIFAAIFKIMPRWWAFQDGYIPWSPDFKQPCHISTHFPGRHFSPGQWFQIRFSRKMRAGSRILPASLFQVPPLMGQACPLVTEFPLCAFVTQEAFQYLDGSRLRCYRRRR